MFLCALKLGFDTQESKRTQVPTEETSVVGTLPVSLVFSL